MTLGFGHSYLAIPGPSSIPECVLSAMHRAAPNIYEGELVDMVATILPDLRRVARTDHHVAIYICNGHGAWEAALTNTLSRGDRVLVLSNGRFSYNWGDMAARLGAQVDFLHFTATDGYAVLPERVENALRTAAQEGTPFRAVLCTHVDTGNSVRNDIVAIKAALDAANSEALLLVDCIACLACDDFHMDAWGVDVMITASQKGLMTPPGLGFVFFNPRAAERQRTADMVTPYWDWAGRVDPELFYLHFFGTAPTHHLFGLRAALTLLLETEGLEAALKRHAVLARAVWAALDAWGDAAGGVQPIIANSANRSHAVTAVYSPLNRGSAIRQWMVANTNVTLGIGLGMVERTNPDWHGHFRIAHMGHVNAHMTLGVLACLDAAFKALEIPHGAGAIEAAAKVCADACTDTKERAAASGCCD